MALIDGVQTVQRWNSVQDEAASLLRHNGVLLTRRAELIRAAARSFRDVAVLARDFAFHAAAHREREAARKSGETNAGE